MHKTTRFILGILSVALVVGVVYFVIQKEDSVEEPLIPLAETGQQFDAYLTAYTYYDNTPPGTPVIAFAKSFEPRARHEVAGGTGTYEDPITLAVGHTILGEVDTPDFMPGTLFYIPNVRRYFIVEDTCGDGPTPQNGPCHTLDDEARADKATIWLDMWIGGEGASEETVTACTSTLTGTFRIVKDPLPNYVVTPGPLFQNDACAVQYGNKAVLQ